MVQKLIVVVVLEVRVLLRNYDRSNRSLAYLTPFHYRRARQRPSIPEQCRSALEAVLQKWAHFVQNFRESCRRSRADMWLFLIGTVVREDCPKPVVIF